MITTEWTQESLAFLEMRRDVFLEHYSRLPDNEIVKQNNTQYILDQLEHAIEYQKQIISLLYHPRFFNNRRIGVLNNKKNECLQKIDGAMQSPRIPEFDIDETT